MGDISRRKALEILAKDWLTDTYASADVEVDTPVGVALKDSKGRQVIEFLLPVRITTTTRKVNLLDLARINTGHIQTENPKSKK